MMRNFSSKRPRVYISYRRSSGGAIANLVYSRLRRFRVDAFRDTRNIHSGQFAEILRDQIIQRPNFVLILTPDALQSEWVVREIETALTNHRNIIPVEVGGFRLGKADLPPSISELRNYAAIEFDPVYESTSISRIKKALQPSLLAWQFSMAWAGIFWLTVIALLIWVLGPLDGWPSGKEPKSPAQTKSTVIAAVSATPSSTITPPEQILTAEATALTATAYQNDIETRIIEIYTRQAATNAYFSTMTAVSSHYTRTPTPTQTPTPTSTRTQLAPASLSMRVSFVSEPVSAPNGGCFATLEISVGGRSTITGIISVENGAGQNVVGTAVFPVGISTYTVTLGGTGPYAEHTMRIVTQYGESILAQAMCGPLITVTPRATATPTLTPSPSSTIEIPIRTPTATSTASLSSAESYRVAFNVLDESGNKLGEGVARIYAPSEISRGETVEIILEISVTRPEPEYTETFAIIPTATPDVRPTEIQNLPTPIPAPLAGADFVEIYEYMGARLTGKDIGEFEVQVDTLNTLKSIDLQGKTTWEWYLVATGETAFGIHDLEVVVYYEKRRVPTNPNDATLIPSEKFTEDASTIPFSITVIEPDKSTAERVGDWVEDLATWVKVLAGIAGGLVVIASALRLPHVFRWFNRRGYRRSVKGLKPSIFISYRREDSGGSAGRLYDHLIESKDKQVVFRDVDNIAPGENFEEVIQKAVSECSVMLVVIGKKWLTASRTVNKKKQRRLDDPKDFVHLEVAAGLQQKKRVIPILVDGAKMPTEDDLPSDLKPLATCNAVELRNTSFRQDVEHLIAKLRETEALTQ